MSVKIVIKPNTYFDSVSLMSISTRANKLDGVEQAFVAMATEMNKGVLKNLGLLTPELEQAKNGDLMIVINGKSGVDNEQLLAEIEELFNTKAQSGSHEARYATIASAKKHIPESNLAVISVNGLFAAREARQALQNDLNVMLFSDNVSVEDELALKQLAHEKGLLMMGPDCGTAIINGAALCFGNAVRRGNIGIVGASGTGSQELSVRIHEFGGGVSQLIGTGGRDLSEKIGGLMMLDAIGMLENDPQTEIIVLKWMHGFYRQCTRRYYYNRHDIRRQDSYGRLASRCIPRHSGSILGLYALRCVRDAGKRYHSIARLVTILG